MADRRPVLVAPDAFKGSFSAASVAAAIGRGLEAGDTPVDLCPVADGGEGTLAALLPALGGETAGARVHDPLGRERAAGFALLEDGGTALVEVAEAGGLHLVGTPTPASAWAASTRGTGELIAAAVAAGAAVVLVAAGGSASTDGGAGAIAAITATGGLRGTRLVVLCDVRTPWEECARTFAPQKGADAATIGRLEARLEALAATLPRDPRGVAATGAAGGLAGGLWGALDAVLEPGAPWILDALDVDSRLAGARAVVVGEGRLDATSAEGKVVGEIARRASAVAVPCYAIVGSVAQGAGGERMSGGAGTAWAAAGDAAAREAAGGPAGGWPLAGVRVASTLAALEAAGRALAEQLGREEPVGDPVP